MPRHIIALLAITWICTVTFSYWWGQQSTSLTEASGKSPLNSHLNSSNQPAAEKTNNPSAPGPVSANPEDPTLLSADASFRTIETVRAELTDALTSSSATPGQTEKISDLLNELAAYAPLEALQYADALPSLRASENARERILETWAKNDPQAALTWITHESADLPIRRQQSLMQAVLRGYASVEPQAALQYTLALEANTPSELRRQSRYAAEVIETQIREGDLGGAKLTIENMETGTLKSNLMRELVDEWASYDPVSAAAYVDNLGEEAPTNLKTALIGEWSRIDPEAAADWIGSLPPEDPAIARSASEIIREWTRYDLTASAEWLNSLPASPDLDRAVASYTWRASEEDPGSAMSWAESISNDWMRTRSMERVAAGWKAEDPDGFETYLETASLNDEQKESLRKATANRGRGWR